MQRQKVMRTMVLALFVLLCLAIAGAFYLNTGGHVRGVNTGTYSIRFESTDVNGLISDSEVRIAGVVVGRVTDIEAQGAGGKADVELTLDPEVVPVHQGATVRVGLKELIGSYYVDLVDGRGAPLPDGARLPAEAAVVSPELHDVLRSLRPETRAALSKTVQSLGTATNGRSQDVARLVEGLGTVGREGYTALDAVAAQSEDLRTLSREAGALLDTLDVGRGQIVQVVTDAQTITNATAGQRPALEDSVRKLPGVLESAQVATRDLTTLSDHLQPVAADLRRAAPDLNAVLLQLPGVTKDLRGLLPKLDGTLERAPATLKRVPTLGRDVRALTPVAGPLLQDLNPALAYAAPFGRDIGSMLSSFGSSMDADAENGVNPIRLAAVFNTQSVRNLPINVDQLDPLTWSNAFPKPGAAGSPTPFTGQYTRVERDPAPK